jgi:hypothetical protein
MLVKPKLNINTVLFSDGLVGGVVGAIAIVMFGAGDGITSTPATVPIRAELFP